MLTIYDITSAICRYNKINIEKIYIIGKGPKRAIRLLDVKAKSQKIENITLKYVEIPEILKAFQEKKYEINLQIKIVIMEMILKVIFVIGKKINKIFYLT